jgi:hypothetical protein
LHIFVEASAASSSREHELVEPTYTDAETQQYLRDRLTVVELASYQRQYGAFTQAERQAAADVWADAERLSAES